MKRIFITLIILLLILSGVTGQTPEKKQYKATKLTIAPAIDGILDDDAWKEEPGLTILPSMSPTTEQGFAENRVQDPF